MRALAILTHVVSKRSKSWLFSQWRLTKEASQCMVANVDNRGKKNGKGKEAPDHAGFAGTRFSILLLVNWGGIKTFEQGNGILIESLRLLF